MPNNEQADCGIQAEWRLRSTRRHSAFHPDPMPAREVHGMAERDMQDHLSAGTREAGYMITPEVRHVLVSHTAGIESVLERKIRLKKLLGQYMILGAADRKEAYRICAVPEED
jgi:hypothetical protein